MGAESSDQARHGLEDIVKPSFKNAVLALDCITSMATQSIDSQIIGEWLRRNKVVTKVPYEVSGSYKFILREGRKSGGLPLAPLAYEKVIASGDLYALMGSSVVVEGIELSQEDIAAINVAKNLARGRAQRLLHSYRQA